MILNKKKQSNKGLSLNTRFSFIFGLLLLVIAGTVAATLWIVIAQERDSVVINLAGRQRMLIQKFSKEIFEEANHRQILFQANEFARVLSFQISADRGYYTKNVIGKLKKEWSGFKASARYRRIRHAIPLPATFVREVSEEVEKKGEYHYKLLSKYNINPNKGLRTEFEQQAWDRLSKSPDTSYSEVIRNRGGVELNFATSDPASSAACVSCHNNHKESPKNDFQLNELMGILVVSVMVTQDPVLATIILKSKNVQDEPVSLKTQKLFGTTLVALRDGGITYSDLAMSVPVEIPKTTNPDILMVLAQVEKLWNEMVTSVDVVRSGAINSPEYQKHLQNIRNKNLICLSIMDEVVRMFQADTESQIRLLKTIQYISMLIGFLVVAGGFYYVRSKISRPLIDALQVASAVSEGDLTKTCQATSTDEMGQLSVALNRMCTNLQTMVKEIQINSETLNTSSSEMTGLSNKLSGGADEMLSKSNAVAAAAEEMSTNMNSVAAATEQAATNLKIVTTATEGLTTTINAIAQNSEEARSVTDGAVVKFNDVSELVDRLGEASSDVDTITEVIRSISDKVALLALNATIEAARAGEAGKGFAVVAQEIKDLANQTAEATGQADKKLKLIRGMTSNTSSEIKNITEIIESVSEIVSTIAVSVEDQSKTTREIAGNITQASEGVKEVTDNVTQSSGVAGEIAKDIADVNQAAGETNNSSAEINSSAKGLTALAAQLKEMVERFRV